MLDYRNPKLVLTDSHLAQGHASWQSPSNIAIVKYWGKHGVQLPRNPSISFTLSEARSITNLHWSPKTSTTQSIELDFLFEDMPNEAFRTKILVFLESLVATFPFLKQLKWRIESKNTFPHSAGIASSASAMSALAICLCDCERQLFGTLENETAFLQKASYLARLGSGSACRSLYPVLGVWGTSAAVAGSSDEYAVAYEGFHPVFETYKDSILIVSPTEKKVSSRAGHALMEGNPYAAPRYEQARRHMVEVTNHLRTGDVHAFGRIAEQEALALHALMMCSNPSFVLMEPNTLEMISRLREWRAETKVPAYFTLDAGPNVHLLYPAESADEVEAFIHSDLFDLCHDSRIIFDEVGQGASRL
jgi:diphosphomevalonate decarboxylase